MVTTSPFRKRRNSIWAKTSLLSHKIVLTPIAGLRYSHLEFGLTTETGGDAALAYRRHDVDSFESRLGVNAKADFSAYGLKITPKLDAAHVHDFEADRQDFGGTFAAGAGQAVDFLGPERSKNWVEVGGGASVTRRNVTLNLDAETTIGRKDLSYQTYSA